NQRRRSKERDAGAKPRKQSDEELILAIQSQLDEELNGLPEKYRLPIVLCILEDKTIKDAAQEVGWPQGTMASRLTRGREALAKRLRRRGITLTAAVLGSALATHVATASVPAALVGKTVHAASVCGVGSAAAGVISAKVLALSEGVVQAMFISKLK